MEAALGPVWKFLCWIVSTIWSRPALRVRIQEDDEKKEVGGLVFEVENIKDKATSLEPVVTASYISVKRVLMSVAFDVREGDRSLPPFTAKQFSASARQRQFERSHSWFRVYKFVPTRGRTCRVRIRNAYLEPMGAFRCWFDGLYFRITGNIIGDNSANIKDYRASQRTKGPH